MQSTQMWYNNICTIIIEEGSVQVIDFGMYATLATNVTRLWSIFNIFSLQMTSILDEQA